MPYNSSGSRQTGEALEMPGSYSDIPQARGRTAPGRWLLAIGPWAIVAAVVLFNVLVVAYEHRFRDAMRTQARAAIAAEQEGAVLQAAEAGHNYLSDVLMELRLIAKLVARSGLHNMPREVLATIARHDIERNRVTEIHVVQRGFTGKEPPVATFELDDDEVNGAARQEHSPEAQAGEHAEIVRQMGVYAENPWVASQLSGTLSPCVLEHGHVLTVPVRRDDELLGLVAAILPADCESRITARAAPRQRLWIVGADGRPINPREKTDARIDVPRERIAEAALNTFSVDGSLLTVCPIPIPGLPGRRWAVAAAVGREELRRRIAGRVGGFWSVRLSSTLGLGNLLGLYLLLLLGHWRRQSEVFRAQAERDGLTGLFLRRKLDRVAESSAGPVGGTIGVLMLDVNDFKAINDTQGHDVGDQVLQAAAALLARSLRADDLAFRMGGDEFLLLLPDFDGPMLVEMSVRIRAAVERWNRSDRPPDVRLSLAIGGASGAAGDLKELVATADQRMYEDKRRWRSRSGRSGAAHA